MKPRQTEMDYAVIAINPALIMLLVGSLVYFLLALFYNGSFDLRLNFIFGAFVFSIVLIARISIEEGWQRATLFALALSGAVLMAVLRFIPDAAAITMVLLAVVWWSANRLTYDCTVVDDSEDASNKGLMQNLNATEEDEQPDQSTLDGVTDTAEETQPKTHWLAELINPTSTHHAPGMWVVYFSLAALPIFGLGQAFVSSNTQSSRFYLFCLLFVYIASALLLLVSTSFLGLRRYLRQRGIEMPLAMTGTWLGVGAVIVVVVLLVCSVIPRPNAEYQLAQFPQFGDGEKQQQSNQQSVGKEGTDDKNPDARKTSGEQKDQNDSETNENKSKQNSSSESDKGTDGDGKKSEDSQSSSKEDDPDSKNSDPNSKEKGEGKQGESSDSEDSGKKQDGSKQDESEKGEGEKQSESSENSGKQGEQKSDPDKQKQESDSNSQKSDSQQQDQSQQQQSNWTPPEVFNSMSDFFKFVIYLIVALVVAYLVWKNREALLKSWLAFLKELREFWQRLFGGQVAESTSEAAEEVAVVNARPFSSFQNPFTSGQARNWSLEKLIQYSFQATEAWAFERGCPREQQQTPQEFTKNLAIRYEDLGEVLRELANCYGQVAYGSGKAPKDSAKCIKELWGSLT
ncbi:MAG: hypothetical protein COA78_27075 [Blastopirellula sp.]|nr:MAG: hypothetical protein COA78_27075 [Blastopirellula sp.]